MAGLSGPDGERATDSVALRRARGEHGSTLIELLAATAIMGIAVVTILAGSSATFTSSASNRQSTTAGIVARSYAEALDLAVSQSGAWCSTSYAVVFTPPSNYTVGAAITSNPVCPSAPNPQLQTVTITVTAPNGSTETLKTVVRKP